MINEFQQAIRDHEDTARCVLLQSSTEGMFCAGADLKERKEMTPAEAKEFV